MKPLFFLVLILTFCAGCGPFSKSSDGVNGCASIGSSVGLSGKSNHSTELPKFIDVGFTEEGPDFGQCTSSPGDSSFVGADTNEVLFEMSGDHAEFDQYAMTSNDEEPVTSIEFFYFGRESCDDPPTVFYSSGTRSVNWDLEPAGGIQCAPNNFYGTIGAVEEP